MTPEIKARQQIDYKLEQAGWVIQDMKQLDLSVGVGIAVREYPTDFGLRDIPPASQHQSFICVLRKKSD